MSGSLALLQADIVARLQADEVLNDYTILDEHRGDLLESVRRALGITDAGPSHKAGLCLIVMAPAERDRRRNQLSRRLP